MVREIYFLTDENLEVVPWYRNSKGLKQPAVFYGIRQAKTIARSITERDIKAMSMKELFRNKDKKSVADFLRFVLTGKSIDVTIDEDMEVLTVPITYEFLRNLGLENELSELLTKTTT